MNALAPSPGRGARRLVWEATFVLLVGLCTAPLWLVDTLAIQDLPQHLAAIRVLHSLHDPAFGLSEYFTLDLFRTQYLAYYLVADLLAYPFGVELGNRMLLIACVVGTPYAMRSLLRECEGNEELSLLTLPLLYNAHLILGFLNFLAAIPLCLFALALTLRDRHRPSRRTSLAVALVLFVAFYTHVIPFAFAALGVVLVHAQASWRPMLRGLAPIAPSMIAAGSWLAWAPAGQASMGAVAGGRSHAASAVFRPMAQAWAELPMWMTDVLHGDIDDALLTRFSWVLLAALLFGFGARWTGVVAQPRYASRLTLLPLLAAVSYFVLPESYDWIWPIAPRFPLLCALLAIVTVPRLPAVVARAVVIAAVVIALMQSRAVAHAFISFDRDEVGELDAAIDAIPAAKRVAGLIFDRGSRQVKFSPFIHSVAYYQVRKGGAVMFSFADFPQSPFAFRDDNRPPRVQPRWEWKPEAVNPVRDLAWYDYVLVRGGPGRIASSRPHYAPVFRGPHWSVWQRLPAR